MNSFFEHHKDSIRWHYRCFDRILLNGLIQPFQQPERVVGFFSTYRQIYPVTRSTLRDIATQFQRWVTERATKRNIPIVEAPKGRGNAANVIVQLNALPASSMLYTSLRRRVSIGSSMNNQPAERYHQRVSGEHVAAEDVLSLSHRLHARVVSGGARRLHLGEAHYVGSAKDQVDVEAWSARRKNDSGIVRPSTKRADTDR
jgi:hypothetical protein